MDFRVILESPQILATRQVGANWFVPGPYNNNSRIPEVEKRVHRIHGPLEYIGYMVHWKRDYSIMLRSLVAPSRGAGGLLSAN